jgi:hypothetical protein
MDDIAELIGAEIEEAVGEHMSVHRSLRLLLL